MSYEELLKLEKEDTDRAGDVAKMLHDSGWIVIDEDEDEKVHWLRAFKGMTGIYIEVGRKEHTLPDVNFENLDN